MGLPVAHGALCHHRAWYGMGFYVFFFSEYELDKGDTIGCLPVEHMPDAT